MQSLVIRKRGRPRKTNIGIEAKKMTQSKPKPLAQRSNCDEVIEEIDEALEGERTWSVGTLLGMQCDNEK